jgi:hypothetical protein
VLAASVGLFAVTGASARGDDAGASSLPACVRYRAFARYVPYGYNHVVSLENGCSRRASCTVRTDVNPEPVAAEVAAGATAEVVTFVGSPQQTFTPQVSCALK